MLVTKRVYVSSNTRPRACRYNYTRAGTPDPLRKGRKRTLVPSVPPRAKDPRKRGHIGSCIGGPARDRGSQARTRSLAKKGQPERVTAILPARAKRTEGANWREQCSCFHIMTGPMGASPQTPLPVPGKRTDPAKAGALPCVSEGIPRASAWRPLPRIGNTPKGPLPSGGQARRAEKRRKGRGGIKAAQSKEPYAASCAQEDQQGGA